MNVSFNVQKQSGVQVKLLMHSITWVYKPFHYHSDSVADCVTIATVCNHGYSHGDRNEGQAITSHQECNMELGTLLLIYRESW